MWILKKPIADQTLKVIINLVLGFFWIASVTRLILKAVIGKKDCPLMMVGIVNFLLFTKCVILVNVSLLVLSEANCT